MKPDRALTPAEYIPGAFPRRLVEMRMKPDRALTPYDIMNSFSSSFTVEMRMKPERALKTLGGAKEQPDFFLLLALKAKK